MGIDLPATDGSVEPTPSAIPIESPASARPKRPAKVKSPKPQAASAPAISVAPPADSEADKPEKKKVVRKPAAKKAPAKAVVPKKKASAKAAKTSTNGEVTPELIAIRAFLVWEKRAQQGLPGDEISDWVEAERQLFAERST